MKSIGDYAFKQCSSLSSLTIPTSVKSIGEDIFDSPVNNPPSIDPNSMSWPKPSYATKWKSKADGTKEKLVKFGKEQTTIIYNPSIKRYSVGCILIALYTNYNDAEAAAYFALVHGLRRSHGLDRMFKK